MITPQHTRRDALRSSERQLMAAAARLDDRDAEMAVSLIEDLAEAAETLDDVQDRPKVAVFGSARLDTQHDAYQAVVELSGRLADSGYVIVTGGGPGAMTAGLHGAGPERAVGIGIELPFEKRAPSSFAIAQLQRFATRKLALVRHVRGVVAAAGGFGTLDEVLEVLVLLQTGKKRPTPLVLLDVGTSMWSRFDAWVRDELVPAGLISKEDVALYRVCTSVDEAVDEITEFWSSFQGMPEGVFDDERLVLRVRHRPGESRLVELREQFADFAPDLDVLPELVDAPAGSPVPHCPALAFSFDRRRFGRLRQLIDAVNAGGVPASAGL